MGETETLVLEFSRKGDVKNLTVARGPGDWVTLTLVTEDGTTVTMRMDPKNQEELASCLIDAAFDRQTSAKG